MCLHPHTPSHTAVTGPWVRSATHTEAGKKILKRHVRPVKQMSRLSRPHWQLFLKTVTSDKSSNFFWSFETLTWSLYGSNSSRPAVEAGMGPYPILKHSQADKPSLAADSLSCNQSRWLHTNESLMCLCLLGNFSQYQWKRRVDILRKNKLKTEWTEQIDVKFHT